MVNLKLDNNETTNLPLFESDIELLRQCIEMKRLLENKKISFKNFSNGLMKSILMDQKKLITFDDFKQQINMNKQRS
jgi:hypothetical protein